MILKRDNEIETCVKPKSNPIDRDIITALTLEPVEQQSETEADDIISDIGQEHSTLWTT